MSNETKPSQDDTVADKIVRSAKSEDKPLGEQEPAAPFAVVGLTYLLILIVVVAGVAAVLWAFR